MERVVVGLFFVFVFALSRVILAYFYWTSEGNIDLNVLKT